MGRTRARLGDLTGAAADLGVFVPLSAGLVSACGLDAGAVLLAAGALVLASGLAFRVPFSVQPLKALAAVAIARRLGPDVIHAAGIEIAVVLLVLSIGRIAHNVARLFTKPVVRALQFGVGGLLVITAFEMAAHASASAGMPSPILSPLTLPPIGLPGLRAFAPALLLVVPQLPLTLGNAVVGTTDVAARYFGERARRVTRSGVLVSSGVGNLVSALVGGMPMCHGAGGLTAHYRLGARTAAMNLFLGGAMVTLGLFLAPSAFAMLGAIPVPVLAGLLAYAGLRHALLIADLRGRQAIVAIAAGAAGVLSGNLVVTLGVALVAEATSSALRRDRRLQSVHA